MLRTRWSREPQPVVALFDPYVALLSLFRFFGVGAQIRVVAEKPA